MFPSEVVLGGVILVGLVLYFLLGGADFGGGVWDLFATGPRAAAQRAAIERAIAPVWEPNHVWLIFVIVVLFTAFPTAFAALATGLYVPLTLFLVGIVLRGSAFSFRALHHHDDVSQRRWGRVFSIASVVSPFLLGAMVGAVATGRIGSPSAQTGAWLSAFTMACGALSLCLAAFLAATYLAVEVTDAGLRDDFRRRALLTGLAAGPLAALAFVLSWTEAPLVYSGLSSRPLSWPLHILTGVAAVGALLALWRGRFLLARVMAAAQVTLVIAGWAASQFPYLVPPGLTLDVAAAPARTRALLLAILAAGVPVLVPSLVILYRVFKSRASEARAAATTATAAKAPPPHQPGAA